MFSIKDIKQLSAEIGFSDCGVAPAQQLDCDFYPLHKWLAGGMHADMHYMERNTDKRQDVRLLVEGARSVISVVVAYKSDRLVEGGAKIAQYAYGEDYHERLKSMMHRLMARMKEYDAGFEGRAFVDTAPISDRHWAVMAGLGRMGKNGLFFHPRYGSFCFLGEIVTTAEFDHYDKPLTGAFLEPCEGCNLCVDSCPNHAIIKISDIAYGVDARRCTSYNTIENRAEKLPSNLNRRGYVFGCDICQLVCPRNTGIPASYKLSDDRKELLEKLPQLDEADFIESTRHSAMNRVSYQQWRRNCDGIT